MKVEELPRVKVTGNDRELSSAFQNGTESGTQEEAHLVSKQETGLKEARRGFNWGLHYTLARGACCAGPPSSIAPVLTLWLHSQESSMRS